MFADIEPPKIRKKIGIVNKSDELFFLIYNASTKKQKREALTNALPLIS